MNDESLIKVRDAFKDPTPCDTLLCDPPYSARTHAGHIAGTCTGDETLSRKSLGRRPIEYAGWEARHVHDFVDAWAPVVDGWICVLTDHLLGPIFHERFEAHSRMSFAPVPCIEKGVREVRLTGDGPACCAVWLMVSRPRRSDFMGWGSLPGYYLMNRDASDRGERIVGGKPPSLISAIMRDYSRPGDLVCDPFSGGGTTGVVAARLGRRFAGREIDPDTAEKANNRILFEQRQTTLWAPGRENEG